MSEVPLLLGQALRGGIPRVVSGDLGLFLEPFVDFWPRFSEDLGKLTFEIPPRRALRGVTNRPRSRGCYKDGTGVPGS